MVKRLQLECRLGSSLVCHLGSSPYLHHLGSSPYLQQVFNAKHPSERCSVVDEHTARAVHLVRPRLMKERRDRILYFPPCADMSVAEFSFSLHVQLCTFMALIYAFVFFRRNRTFGTMRKRKSGNSKNLLCPRTVAGYSFMVMVERLQLVYYWAFRRICNGLAFRHICNGLTMQGIHQKDVWLWMDTQKDVNRSGSPGGWFTLAGWLPAASVFSKSW